MKRLLVVLGLVLAVGVALASTALASSPSPGSGPGIASWMRGRAAMLRSGAAVQTAAPTPAPGGMMGGMMSGGMMGGGTSGPTSGPAMHDDLEVLLGLSHQEIHDQMMAGKSLVEMAAAKGVSKDQLIKTIVDGRRAALDQAVKAGQITQEQAATMLQNLQKNVEAMVTAQGMNGMMGGSGGMMGGCHGQDGQPSQSSGQTGGTDQPQGDAQQA